MCNRSKSGWELPARQALRASAWASSKSAAWRLPRRHLRGNSRAPKTLARIVSRAIIGSASTSMGVKKSGSTERWPRGAALWSPRLGMSNSGTSPAEQGLPVESESPSGTRRRIKSAPPIAWRACSCPARSTAKGALARSPAVSIQSTGHVPARPPVRTALPTRDQNQDRTPMQQRANAPWKSPCATVLPPVIRRRCTP